MAALGGQPRENLAGFLQLGLCLCRLLLGQKLHAPLRTLSSQSQLKLLIIRLSFGQFVKDFGKAGSELNN